ncbi:hypothetical protein E1B28_006283 [Marasmius oreades]|uniref:Uncharacterized protein n=1 Tax=Marasmius oreades TaxID=181124 RepID=A0A9P7S5I4_9AGAR|nr:uncharacterized protein E1B28_006283 [Marasmius oreades]KAG7095545.1 hypothetical protein E1B28_006283 [Marasmius oreades]
MPVAVSRSPFLTIASTVFATIWVGFGVNAILNPDHALSFFEFRPPLGAADKKLVDSLMAVYGIRDIFMGLATYAATFVGDRKTLGWILVFGSAVAYADGVVCLMAENGGEWSHWGYGPMLTIVGVLLLGVLG